MQAKYKHHLFARRSPFVKYRGNTGQIDIKDTVITILSKQPGLKLEELANLIFDPSLTKSIYFSLPRALGVLEDESVIVREESEDRYYLMSDAMSHDIGKTKHMMDTLLARGITPEQVNFLSSGIIMAGEAAKAEAENINYNRNATVAASMVEESTDQISITKIEPWKEENVEVTEAVDTPNPFVNMSERDNVSIKLQVAADIIKENEAKEKAKIEAEHAKALAEAEARQKEIDKLAEAQLVEPERGIVITKVEDKPEETKTFFGWLKSFLPGKK